MVRLCQARVCLTTRAFGVEYSGSHQQEQAEVAEQADALRSGRSELYAHVGSTPTFGTFCEMEISLSVSA